MKRIVHLVWAVENAAVDEPHNATSKEIAPRQRRGAAILLSMLAAPRPSVVADHLNKLVAVGLGAMGNDNLVLARDSCIALSWLGGSAKKLSQLIFLTVKHPVHLELVKRKFKRRKAANDQALRPVVLSSPIIPDLRRKD
ncbi:hypothetical protein PTTG_06844 [Puccinia triticina 1-1 BBBD Race 1]|uniref:Uncharacterized protein n=1 Tax=Puccinia triticina (isolate 1-1 / race 1 (BBBD)) TaxID=630390 RepID=A0A0C4F174_PUCT1|nr:hypothetical protein PTTG_06844 [Puccinia triticina 1-1 BBBD Race 1]